MNVLGWFRRSGKTYFKKQIERGLAAGISNDEMRRMIDRQMSNFGGLDTSPGQRLAWDIDEWIAKQEFEAMVEETLGKTEAHE